MRFFDDSFTSEAEKCLCCYSCIKQHSGDGCSKCSDFIDRFFTQKNAKLKVSKTLAAELIEALEELFTALRMEVVVIEDELEVTTESFIKDFVKVLDEVRSENDLVEMWHLNPSVAHKVFMLFQEVVFGGPDFSVDSYDTSDDELISNSDVLDLSSTDEDN